MRFDVIVVPRGAEAFAVERGWRGSRPPLLLVPAGASAGRALHEGRPIETALVLGLCGALDPALCIGDPVVYARIVDGAQTIELDPQLATSCALTLKSTPRSAANVAAVVGNVREKALLRASTRADAIDMEASAIARALHSRGVRVAMVRVVSDAAAFELPDLSDVYDARGALRPLALVRAFARTPRSSLRFIGNAVGALAALRVTAQRLSS